MGSYPAATMRKSRLQHDRDERPLTTCTTETDIAHPIDITTPHRLDVPESQGSVVSTISSTFSAPALPSTSSNLSSDYDVASPSEPNGPSAHSKPAQESMATSPSRSHSQVTKANAPQIDTATANAPRTGRTTATPMSLVSPTTQGFKRNADGSAKGDGSIASPTERTFAHKRTKSMDTHSSTRIGEVRDHGLRHDHMWLTRMQLSAQLKTRLSYAMVKVQNGWEKQSLEELEEVHSQRGSPNSAPGGSRVTFDSPSTSDYRRRPSAVSDSSEFIMASPASDSLRSHALNPGQCCRSTMKS